MKIKEYTNTVLCTWETIVSKCECSPFTLASLVGKMDIDGINTQVNENIIVVNPSKERNM